IDYIMSKYFGLFIFFFQAEDGIRDFHVTGVQTCALPISRASSSPWPAAARLPPRLPATAAAARPHPTSSPASSRTRAGSMTSRRSEERRVGKECRARWWPVHINKRRESSVRYEVGAVATG